MENMSKAETTAEKSKFMELTVDIHLEVFKLLDPVNLFHLSRVSIKFYKFLTSNTMNYLWKLVSFLFFWAPTMKALNVIGLQEEHT
jgi:hypothetical protein